MAIDTLSLIAAALRRELHTAPKPGLVDRHNSGSHEDLSYQVMSADIPLVVSQAEFAINLAKAEPKHNLQSVFAKLRANGRQLETKLGGGKTNTYKGLIFAFSFLAYGLELALKDNVSREQFIRNWRAQISCLAKYAQSDYEEQRAEFIMGFGYQAKLAHGRNGAREEALRAYPLVFDEALPMYEETIALGISEESAALLCLLLFISKLSDSNLYKRIGYEEARLWQENIGEKLADLIGKLPRMGVENFELVLREYMTELDRVFIEINASPGGAADQLAILFFVYEVLKRHFP